MSREHLFELPRKLLSGKVRRMIPLGLNEMDVRIPEPRNQRFTGTVKDSCAARDPDSTRFAYTDDSSICDDNYAVRDGLRTWCRINSRPSQGKPIIGFGMLLCAKRTTT